METLTALQILTRDIEHESRTWLAIVEWACKASEAVSESLRRRGVDERDADFYRGQASTLETLLLINTKRRTPEETP